MHTKIRFLLFISLICFSTGCAVFDGPAEEVESPDGEGEVLELEDAPYADDDEPSVIQSKPSSDQDALESLDDNTPGDTSVVGFDAYPDPLAWFNKPMFAFNDVTYRYLLSPLGKGYQAITPDPIENGIGRFFLNLREPLNFFSNVFKADWRDSGVNVIRFGVNSTLGLLGFFDVSESWFDIEPEPSNFNETFGAWGIGHGPYLVLPFFGPSDLRDGTSLFFDRAAHPFTYLDDQDTALALTVFDGFQRQVPTLVDYPDLVNELENPYEYIRNLYLQNRTRDALYGDGEPEETP